MLLCVWCVFIDMLGLGLGLGLLHVVFVLLCVCCMSVQVLVCVCCVMLCVCCVFSCVSVCMCRMYVFGVCVSCIASSAHLVGVGTKGAAWGDSAASAVIALISVDVVRSGPCTALATSDASSVLSRAVVGFCVGVACFEVAWFACWACDVGVGVGPIQTASAPLPTQYPVAFFAFFAPLPLGFVACLLSPNLLMIWSFQPCLSLAWSIRSSMLV